MVLELRTANAWQSPELAPGVLCLRLAHGPRICAGSQGGRPALVTGGRVLAASVARPDNRSLSATFSPRELRVHAGTLRWRAETPEDSLPDTGSYGTAVGAFGAIRCFGAAARTGCRDPALRRRVFPSPSRAAWMAEAPCAPTADRRRYRAIEPCLFGEPGEAPRVALIGDSHAAHLRATVDVFARALGWGAISITRPGCAFSTEAYPAPPPVPARCRRHTAEALRWLRRHPSVTTVFTSSSAGRGLSPGGFAAAWSRAPASVGRIYEVRDVPRVSYATAGCVQAVLRRHARSAGACSVARAGAFPFDPAAAAAAGARGRVRLLDLSRYFCDARRCYPIIGGAYVYKDFNHLNRVFAATLGPVLLRLTGHAARAG
jgi:hypothetical protein